MKQYKRIMRYVAVLTFILMFYSILPRIWYLIPSSVSDVFYPLLYPLESYAIQHGLNPDAMIITILLAVGLIVTILFCFLIMREFERAIIDFTYDVKKKLIS